LTPLDVPRDPPGHRRKSAVSRALGHTLPAEQVPMTRGETNTPGRLPRPDGIGPQKSLFNPARDVHHAGPRRKEFPGCREGPARCPRRRPWLTLSPPSQPGMIATGASPGPRSRVTSSVQTRWKHSARPAQPAEPRCEPAPAGRAELGSAAVPLPRRNPPNRGRTAGACPARGRSHRFRLRTRAALANGLTLRGVMPREAAGMAGVAARTPRTTLNEATGLPGHREDRPPPPLTRPVRALRLLPGFHRHPPR